MNLIPYLLILTAYLLGSISSAVIFVSWQACLTQEVGSHNAGATNVLRIGGKSAALGVLLFDILKAHYRWRWGFILNSLLTTRFHRLSGLSWAYFPDFLPIPWRKRRCHRIWCNLRIKLYCCRRCYRHLATGVFNLRLFFFKCRLHCLGRTVLHLVVRATIYFPRRLSLLPIGLPPSR